MLRTSQVREPRAYFPIYSDRRCPDPAIIKSNGRWYAFATRTLGPGAHIQVAESQDFNTWSFVPGPEGSEFFDALPDLPDWVDEKASNTVRSSHFASMSKVDRADSRTFTVGT